MYTVAILLVAITFCAAQQQVVDEANQLVLDILYDVFNGDKKCYDQVVKSGLVKKAIKKKDFTEVAKRVGKCSPATAELAEQFNTRPEDIIASVAGALNDIHFRGCKLGKIIEDAGCKLPPMTYKRQDADEVAEQDNSMCAFIWCAASALQEQKDPKCQAGISTYYGVAMHQAEMNGCVTY